jgi:ABC-2 type transport system permease protein
LLEHARERQRLRAAIALVLLALAFGIPVASGVLGLVLLIILAALWAVLQRVYVLIALTTRSAAATNSVG